MKQALIATPLLGMTQAQTTLTAIRMYFDLLPDSTSLPQMTTNYCLLGYLKQTQMATPLMKMTQPQKTLKAIRMYFDLLPDSSSLQQMTTN